MPRILNVVWGPFPDIRLEKTGRLLGEAGYSVDVLCLEHRGKAWQWGDVIVPRLPSNIALRFLRRIATTVRRDPVEFPWRILGAFRNILSARQYQVVQWNDLPGVVEAADICRYRGVKLVLDMHENFADNMWSTERDNGTQSYRYNMNSWLAYERKACTAVDRILVNIEEMGNRLIGMHSIAPERLSVVRNAEPPDLWEGSDAPSSLRQRFAAKTIMLYVGGLSVHRGIDVIIRAMALVRDCLPNLQFVVVGDGNGLPRWRSLAKDIGVADNVVFEGWKSFREAQTYYQIADFGVIPHHQYSQTDNGIPHKLAQNFLNGVPVLASSCHALERVIRETGAGQVFRAGHPGDAAEAIITMCGPDNCRADMAQAARRAAASGPFSWERMRSDIISAYRAL